MVLKLPGQKFDCSSACENKVFAWMGHSILVGGGRNFEFLLELYYLKDYRLGFVEYTSS